MYIFTLYRTSVIILTLLLLHPHIHSTVKLCRKGVLQTKREAFFKKMCFQIFLERGERWRAGDVCWKRVPDFSCLKVERMPRTTTNQRILAVGMVESGTSRDCNSKTIWSVKDILLGCSYIAARLELFLTNPAVGTAPSNDPAAGWLHHCHTDTCGTYFSYKQSLLDILIVQELCESRGGRPGLSVLTSLLASVNINLY